MAQDDVVGFSLRCNMYCVDHRPKGMNRSERKDLIEITRGDPKDMLASDCAECGKTLGEVLTAKG